MIHLLFGTNPVDEDIDRWRSQKFQFAESIPFLLEQSHGGPCGVLAPVQAFLMAKLEEDNMFWWDKIDATNVWGRLVVVLNEILATAGSMKIVRLEGDNISSSAKLDEPLCREMSVLDFLASLVLTRGIDQVKADMDDPSVPLIGRFGHCSQEVLNLVLFGRATSNVFDGDQRLGDEKECVMVLSGVPDVPITVGLLSELEALRYITVGSRLKNPIRPIWVLGSPTHYTVLVGKEALIPAEGSNALANAFQKHQLDEGIALEESLKHMLAELDIKEFPSERIVSDGIFIFQDFEQLAKSIYPDRWPEAVEHKELSFLILDGQVPARMQKVRLSKSESKTTGSPVFRTRWPQMYVHVDG